MKICCQRMLLLLALASSCAALQAGELCDASCTLTIGFPNGGSIEAGESLTLGFGAGGLVDTAGSVTAYLDGETLTLNAGERLEFGAGGSFDIGNGGNIEYTDMSVTTTGEVTISASGGAELVQVGSGDRLAFFGGGTIWFQTRAFGAGRLELHDGSELHVVAPAGGTSPPGGDLTIGGGSVTINGTQLDLGTTSASTIITAGTLDIVSSALLLDPEALNAALEDPTSISLVSLDPALVVATLDPQSIMLPTSADTGASTAHPAWLLLAAAACAGRCRRRRVRSLP